MVSKQRKRWGVQCLVLLMALCAVMTSHAAGALQCQAIFADGLQTHDTKGDVHFDWNAQLLGNPDLSLATKKVVVSKWANAKSCGTDHCVADGTSSPELDLQLLFDQKQNQHQNKKDHKKDKSDKHDKKDKDKKHEKDKHGKGAHQSNDFRVKWRQKNTVPQQAEGEYNHINVGSFGTLTFDSDVNEYFIEQLNAGFASTIEFTPGNYWIKKLTLGSLVKVKVLGGGPVRLFVENPIDIGWNSEINIREGAQTPETLLIYGVKGIQVGSSAKVSAYIYTQEKAHLHAFSVVYGAISARAIKLNSSATVHYSASSVIAADQLQLCTTNLEGDLDGDGIPDSQDDDIDGDGVLNDQDAFPRDPSESSDLDGDGIGDNADTDRDGDGISNDLETQLGFDPDDANSTPPDLDGDGNPDELDDDRDGDGVPNDQDAFPEDANESSDLDGDGIGDNADTDRDGDGISNDDETQVGTDPDDPNSTPPDLDHDGIPDSLDEDRDGDGVLNTEDAFPDNPAEWSDLDGDGQGDNADPDRDGDGFTNEAEIAANTDPNNANDYPDTVAPMISVHNANPYSVEAATAVLNATITDPVQPYSGIDSVTVLSDRYPDTQFSGSWVNGQFTAELPLKIEVNTFTVVAKDPSGNETQTQWTVDRISPPRFANVTPVSGTVVTESPITIAGDVLTFLPLTDVAFYVNEWQITPTGTGQEGRYTFELPNIPVAYGNNEFTLRVETSDGSESSLININYTPEDAESIPAPVIIIQSPSDGSLLKDQSFQFAARVESQGGPLSITLNGSPISLATSNLTQADFSRLVSFADGSNELSISVAATDSLGKTSTATAHYYRDAEAPVITLDQALSPSPTPNEVLESPYTLTGIVQDANLASFMVNDTSVPLKPGNEAGSYTFSFAVPLSAGQALPLNFEARDLGGNVSTVEYLLQSSATVSLDAVLPPNNTELLSQGEPINVQVVARTGAMQAGDQVWVSVDGQNGAALEQAGTLASGSVTVPAASGDYILQYELRNATGLVLAKTQRTITVKSEQDVPLVVTRIEPENSARFVEINKPIELYFNKKVDLSKVTLSVRETLHGHTYLNLDEPGLDFLKAKGYQLQEVHRDLELVPGSVELLPGDTTVAFYPKRPYGFAAQLYVDLAYDGVELARSQFSVRELPTFVIGGVTDQFGQPLSGIKVELPELKRSAVTNGDGGFAFGFQEAPDQVIPGGRYQVVINPDLVNPGFGVQLGTVNLQEGRKNDVGVFSLQELSKDIPFQILQGGRQASLVGGAFELDLNNATLIFPNGRDTGRVHTQFMPISQLSVESLPSAMPLWVYANQPRGIDVSGPVGITITMPKLQGSYDYVPSVFQYAVLVGYNPENEVLEPIGVGKIENYRVISAQPVNVQSFDYFGYALVNPVNNPLLEAVANGDKTLQQLKAELQ